MTTEISQAQLLQAFKDCNVEYETKTIKSEFIGIEYQVKTLNDAKKIEKYLNVRTLFKGSKTYPYHITFYN